MKNVTLDGLCSDDSIKIGFVNKYAVQSVKPEGRKLST